MAMYAFKIKFPTKTFLNLCNNFFLQCGAPGKLGALALNPVMQPHRGKDKGRGVVFWAIPSLMRPHVWQMDHQELTEHCKLEIVEHIYAQRVSSIRKM